jgi:iron uptake system component EfeO
MRPASCTWGSAAAAALAALALAGCGGGSGQSAPDAAGTTSTTGPRMVNASVSDAGCEPAELSVPSGPATFRVTNRGSTTVGEYELVDSQYVVLGEVYLAADETGSFTLTLQPGRYRTLCPGGTDTPEGVLIVTGERVGPPASPLAERAVASYRRFLEAETALLIERVGRFAAAIERGDLPEARRLFPIAREPYERVEPVAERFGDLDPSIDAREGDVPDADWRGFHRIEKGLWVANSTDGLATFAQTLVADTQRLQTLVRDVELEPAQIANGAKELIDEIFRSKITGEEDRYSHTDLWDFAANIRGARAAFESVRPLLIGKHAALARTAQDRLRALEGALDRFRKGDGYVAYTALRPADTRRLAVLLDALAEPMGQVAAAVVQ